jgi:predicted methyltransferase
VNRNIIAFQDTSLFSRMTAEEFAAMCELEADKARVKSCLKEGIIRAQGDAGDSALIGVLGLQDVVVANRFLCHMESAAAEMCLRNIARLVKPGGYLFVSGVDLDVRTGTRNGLETGHGSDKGDPRRRPFVEGWMASGLHGIGTVPR